MTLKPVVVVAFAFFLLGCVAQRYLFVPPAHADNVKRFEHWCTDVDGTPKSQELERISAEGWELAAATFRPPVVTQGNSIGGGATLLCFKRQR